MKLLDLFCGAGGCSMGYHRAGFEVVGVDSKPQKRYPFDFIQADALEFAEQHGSEFDVIHASPPCQRYSAINRAMGNTESHPDLVAPTREILIDSGKPYIIENVVGAPLHFPIVLCGSMFGLEIEAGWLRRHRLFECSHLLLGVPECRHQSMKQNIGIHGGNQERKPSIGVYGKGTNKWHREKLKRNITVDEQRELMGIDWMSRRELTQSIPPTYTEWVGKNLLRQIADNHAQKR